MAAAWQDAEPRAHRGTPQHRRCDLPELLAAQPQARHPLDDRRALDAPFEVAEDLRQAEQPDSQRDEVETVVELAGPEGEPRRAGVEVLADRSEQQTQHDHRQRLRHRPAGQGDRRDQAEHDQAEVLGRAELERGGRQRRGEQGDQHGRHRSREERAECRSGQGGAGSPLLGHLMAVECSDGGRRLPGNVDQDRGRRAAVLGPVVDPGEHDQRCDGVEVEGDRQQERDRRGRPDAGENTDSRAKGDTEEADQDVRQGQCGLEAEEEVAEIQAS